MNLTRVWICNIQWVSHTCLSNVALSGQWPSAIRSFLQSYTSCAQKSADSQSGSRVAQASKANVSIYIQVRHIDCRVLQHVSIGWALVAPGSTFDQHAPLYWGCSDRCGIEKVVYSLNNLYKASSLLCPEYNRPSEIFNIGRQDIWIHLNCQTEGVAGQGSSQHARHKHQRNWTYPMFPGPTPKTPPLNVAASQRTWA